MYKATVRPIMTNAQETLAEASRTRQLLEANELKILRKIVGRTKIECTRKRAETSETRQMFEAN